MGVRRRTAGGGVAAATRVQRPQVRCSRSFVDAWRNRKSEYRQQRPLFFPGDFEGKGMRRSARHGVGSETRPPASFASYSRVGLYPSALVRSCGLMNQRTCQLTSAAGRLWSGGGKRGVPKMTAQSMVPSMRVFRPNSV